MRLNDIMRTRIAMAGLLLTTLIAAGCDWQEAKAAFVRSAADVVVEQVMADDAPETAITEVAERAERTIDATAGKAKTSTCPLSRQPKASRKVPFPVA